MQGLNFNAKFQKILKTEMHCLKNKFQEIPSIEMF